MVTFNFGFERNIELSILHTWMLLLVAVLAVVACQVYRKRCALCFRYIGEHFNIMWYFFIMTSLTVLTVYHFESINYKELNFAAIAASALIAFLFLPFFKRVVAFGIEAETVALLEKRANLEATEKIIGQESDSCAQDSEKLAMLKKFQSLKNEVKVD